jgi:hypothetical protein
MPSQPNLVQVNWDGQQLQLTPGIARQLAAAQNTGASALQAQDEDIDMPTPPDSPTLRPINLGQQAPQTIVNQGPANAPNPLPVQQNLAQPVQQENVGQAQNRRRAAREPHPDDPTRLWCTSNSHYRPAADFDRPNRRYKTCTGCCTARQNRHNQNTENAISVDLQQQLNEPAVQPIPLHHDIAAALSDSAVNAKEKELLTQVCKKLMEITLETCVSCHEKWFDLGVNAAGKCRKCSKSGKFSAENVMDPGSVPLNC